MQLNCKILLKNMSPENIESKYSKNEGSFEIKFGVPFKPFERVRKPYWPKKGEDPGIVPERYEHTLLLRKKVLFLGIEGYIDLISENPKNQFASLVKKYPLEQPLGLAYFKMIYHRSKDNVEYTQHPFILRFAFIPKNPAQYTKLLNSYVDVNLNKEEYLLVWNLSKPSVQERMQMLETGEKVVIVEKNLFNTKVLENSKPEERSENKRIGRVTFVWLPDEFKQLRTIKLTFDQFDNGDDLNEPSNPISPNKEQLAVPV